MVTFALAPAPDEEGRKDPALPRASHRVLSISADMGGGHDATAAALEDAALRLWPGSEVRRLDTLDLLGPGIGRLFRAVYVTNVERTPWLYEFFYSSLWRHRWFAASSKRVVGSWCGRRLMDPIDRFDPTVVLSTYPMGSAGLAWLAAHRGFTVPVGAYVSDFAPHPFWVHRDLDVNFVVHEAAVASAHAADPGAVVAVCAPPVLPKFARGDRDGSRRALGLRLDAFVAVVSCGAYAFGDVAGTVTALVEASPTVQVVALCGKSAQTRARLESLGLPGDRLVALGWTDRMPDYLRAADAVVSNAGGATALEAISCGTPVVLTRPIAAHGRANADLMVVAGLASLCQSDAELTSYVRAALADPSDLHTLQRHAMAHVSHHDLGSGLTRLVTPRTGRRRSSRAWPMRSQDAFFAHVETPRLVQETGVVLELGEVTPGQPLSLDGLREEIGQRAPGLPSLRRRLVRGPRPGWLVQDEVDVSEQITEHVVDGADVAGALDAAVDAAWSTPLPADRPAWSMTLITDRERTRTLLAVKLHHTQGDGISALGLLDRLLSADPQDPLLERSPRPTGSDPVNESDLARLLRGTRQVGTGLWSLATRPPAPAIPLNREIGSLQRQLVRVAFPSAELRRCARAYDARPHELYVAIVAAALGRLLPAAGLAPHDGRLRAMLPIALRPPVMDREFGNWTGSVALDLPLWPMTTSERLGELQSQIRTRVAMGEPLAGQLALRAVGHLPGRAQAGVARLIYNRRFFNVIVSYLSGARGPRWCAGAPVLAGYPVVPLADRVPLTVGVLLSGASAGVAVMLDPMLGLDRGEVTDTFAAAFAEARGPAS